MLESSRQWHSIPAIFLSINADAFSLLKAFGEIYSTLFTPEQDTEDAAEFCCRHKIAKQ